MLTSVKMMSGRQSPRTPSSLSTSSAVRTSYPARSRTPATKCRLISLSSMSRTLWWATFIAADDNTSLPEHLLSQLPVRRHVRQLAAPTDDLPGDEHHRQPVALAVAPHRHLRRRVLL